METKNILITGGSGFIGTNLVNELRGRGHEVTISDLLNHNLSNYIRADVSNFRQINRVFDTNNNFDFVYHLAAEYGRWNGEDYYENLWKTNVIGTKHLLRIQEKKGFKMVFFSSAEVYGDYNGIMNEDVMSTNPIQDTYQMNDYAISKWAGELMCLNSTRSFGTEIVRVRPVNCYGPHEEYHQYRGFIPKFIYNLLHDLPITVYKGHMRIIDYVEDSCRTWANIVENFIPGAVYNVGGKPEWEHDISWYANKIAEVIGKPRSLITEMEAEPDTTHKKSMSFNRAIEDLKHNPEVNPQEGIRRTIEWMKTRYNV